jgi:AcrR family transcriptional regulator
MNKTKRTIFESAIKILSQNGYNSATMDSIASDAGVAKGTLYYHFKSKEEIFKYIIKEGMQILKERIENNTEGQQDSLSKLKILCKIQLELVHEQREFFIVLMSQLWGQDSRQAELREAIKKYIDYMELYINMAIDENVIKVGDPSHLAYTLFGTICSVAMYGLIKEDKQDFEELNNNILNYILNGIQIENKTCD